MRRGRRYIEGKNLALEPPSRIVQAWRTSEFPPGSADSRLEVRLDAVAKGTRITLLHSEIPAGQGAQYLTGWEDFYFTPMRAHFAAAPKKKTATKKRRAAHSGK